MSIVVGSRIYVKGKEAEFGPGTARFVGTTKIAAGQWVGLELDKPNGYNDGVVKGERYFTCPPKHGLLVKISLAELVEDYDKKPAPKPVQTAMPTPTPSAEPAHAPATPTAATFSNINTSFSPAHEPTPSPATIVAPVAVKPTVVAPTAGTTSTASAPSTPTKAPSPSNLSAGPAKLTSKVSEKALPKAEDPAGGKAQPAPLATRTTSFLGKWLGAGHAADEQAEAYRKQLEEVMDANATLERDAKRYQLRNSELEKRSKQLEKDLDTAMVQLRDVLYGNLEKEELLEKESAVGAKARGEVTSIRQVLQQHQLQMQEQQQKHAKEIGEVQQQHHQQFSDAQQQAKTQLEQAQQQFKQQIEELNRRHQEELEAEHHRHEAEIESYRQQETIIEQKRKQMASLHAKQLDLFKEMQRLADEEQSAIRALHMAPHSQQTTQSLPQQSEHNGHEEPVQRQAVPADTNSEGGSDSDSNM